MFVAVGATRVPQGGQTKESTKVEQALNEIGVSMVVGTIRGFGRVLYLKKYILMRQQGVVRHPFGA